MTAERRSGGGAGSASRPASTIRGAGLAGRGPRDRIVAAASDVVATIGFAATKADDIIVTAGVGRRTFWKYFPDKAAAVTAAYERMTYELRHAVQAAYGQETDPVLRVRACLIAIAEFLAADPARAEVLLVQAPAAGRGVIEIRMEAMRRLAELLTTTITALAPRPAGSPDRSQIVIESLAGSLYEVAYAHTLRGEVRQLPSLVPELTEIVLAPYRRRGSTYAPQS